MYNCSFYQFFHHLAGQDGNARIWSIESCELLNIIDNSNINSENQTVPLVCLGEKWGNRQGMMAFGMGVNDKLYVYC